MKITYHFDKSKIPSKTFDGITDTPSDVERKNARVVAIVTYNWGEADLWYAESLLVAQREIPRVYREVFGFEIDDKIACYVKA